MQLGGGQKPCQNNYSRDRSIDIAKGIGIILVVYGHLVNPIHREIFLFHMPLFFLLSGYFFSGKGSMKDYIIKKAKTLLYPFLLFYILFFIYGYLSSNYKSLMEYTFSLKSFTAIDGPLWFLLSLYEISIICFIIEKYLHSEVWKFIATLSITIAGYLLAINKIFIPCCYFSQACIAYVFFYCGYQIKKYKILNNQVTQKYIIIAAIICYCVGIIYGKTDIRWLIISPSYILFLLPALGGSLLVIYLSKYLQNKRYTDWLSYLGKNSLLVMCVHLPLTPLVYSILLPALRGFYSFIGKTAITDEAITGGRICGFLSLIILVPLSLCIGLIVKKLFPFCFAGNSKTECIKAS
ncbi:acyltransferase family protein [Barnesiella intestinihominis]|uniref:acyltransferase family protein n=2 Tax=Barnesiella intestinihominis TaxID=487174 RepID=UPI00374D8F8B